MSLRTISLPIDDISIKQIQPSCNPLREKLEDIDSLCASISAVGLLQPIVVRAVQDHFEVVTGNRRLEACKRLRWKTIPCHVVELNEKESFELSLVENLERENLSPLEEARAFKKYVSDGGWGSLTELSVKIGRSPSYISKRIRLLSLPPEVIDRVFHQGKNSASIAEEFFSLETDEQIALSRTLDISMSSREVRKLAQKIRQSRSESDGRAQLETTWEIIHERQKLVARCIDQTISAFRLALVRLDNVLNKLNNQWVEKEILLQYRVSMHSQIDSLIRLRKKLVDPRRMPIDRPKTSKAGGNAVKY